MNDTVDFPIANALDKEVRFHVSYHHNQIYLEVNHQAVKLDSAAIDDLIGALKLCKKIRTRYTGIL